jgi:uncharacterized protein (DUF302 family)
VIRENRSPTTTRVVKVPMATSLVTRKSPHTFQVTLERFERAIRAAGATMFARVDHATAAASVGLALRPTILFLFGNPKAGTPLMQEAQTIGLDLPLRVLVWQDGNGQVLLTFRNPAAMFADYAISEDDARILSLGSALRNVTDQAVT